MNRRHLAAAAAALSLAALLGTMPLRGAETASPVATVKARADKCADALTAERRVPGRCSST